MSSKVGRSWPTVLFRDGMFRLVEADQGAGSVLIHHCHSGDDHWQVEAAFVFGDSGLCACCGKVAPDSIRGLYVLHNFDAQNKER